MKGSKIQALLGVAISAILLAVAAPASAGSCCADSCKTTFCGYKDQPGGWYGYQGTCRCYHQCEMQCCGK